MAPTTLTEASVLEALQKVKYPGLSRDIVSFGFVKDLSLGGGNVSFRLALTTGSAETGEAIRTECEKALRALAGVSAVTIRLEVGRPASGPGTVPVPAPSVNLLPGTRFTVAVASGKGGVGKSTVAANLAIALVRLGYKVGLLDADIHGPSQQLMMGVSDRPMLTEDEKIVPIERHGVRVMSIGFLMDAETPVIWRGPMVFKAVEQLLGDVDWGEQDFLVVDLPPGTGDAQLTLIQKVALTGAVIVTTPQDVAMVDARKGLAMFQKMNVPVLGIIENMSYFECKSCGHREEIFGYGGGARTAERLNVPFLGEVPIDPRIGVGGDQGIPILVAEPGSVAALAFTKLAGEVVKTVGA